MSNYDRFRDFENNLDSAGPGVDIPERCKRCPEIAHSLGMIANLEARAERAIGVALQVREDIEAEELQRAVKKRTLEKVAVIDQEIENIRGEVESKAGGCNGPITMRGKSRGNFLDIVVCGSPTLPISNQYFTAQAFVRRKKIE